MVSAMVPDCDAQKAQRAMIARPVARVGLGLVRTAVVQGFRHVGSHNYQFLRCDLSHAVRHRAGNGSSRHRQRCHRQRGHQGQDGSREAHRRFTHPPIHMYVLAVSSSFSLVTLRISQIVDLAQLAAFISEYLFSA